VRSVETSAIQIIRLMEREAVSGDYAELRIYANQDAVLHLLNERRDLVRQIETEYSISITVLIDNTIMPGRFRLIKVLEDGKEIHHREESEAAASDRQRHALGQYRGGCGGFGRATGQQGRLRTDHARSSELFG
jgi:hypothetical protein